MTTSLEIDRTAGPPHPAEADEAIHRFVRQQGIEGLVAADFKKRSDKVVVYWNGAVDRAVRQFIAELEVLAKIVRVPYSMERLEAVARRILENHRAAYAVSILPDFSGLRVSVPPGAETPLEDLNTDMRIVIEKKPRPEVRYVPTKIDCR